MRLSNSVDAQQRSIVALCGLDQLQSAGLATFNVKSSVATDMSMRSEK